MTRSRQAQLDGSAATLKLRDKIPRSPHTIFVGINPAIRSAQVGHYYAHPTNHFWRLVSDSGMAPMRLSARDDNLLVQRGFGFTDVAKRPTTSAGELFVRDFEESRNRIVRLLQLRKPRTVAFVSKTAARAFWNQGASAQISYGRQSEKVGDTEVWFLPSTSGQSLGDTSYEEKLGHFKALAKRVQSYFVWTE